MRLTGLRGGVALATGLVLMACLPESGGTPGGPGTPPAPPPADSADACGAVALQGLVGQPASVLQTMKFAQTVRIIRPGTAVTMDYSAARLNITIDGAETIVTVACG